MIHIRYNLSRWLISMSYLCMNISIWCLRNHHQAHSRCYLKVMRYLFAEVFIFSNQSPKYMFNFRNLYESKFLSPLFQHFHRRWKFNSMMKMMLEKGMEKRYLFRCLYEFLSTIEKLRTFNIYQLSNEVLYLYIFFDRLPSLVYPPNT